MIPANVITAMSHASSKVKRGAFTRLRKESQGLPPSAFLELFPDRLSVLRFLGALPLELFLFPGTNLEAI